MAMSFPAGAGACACCRILALFSSQISSLLDSLILTPPLSDERHLTQSVAIVSQETPTSQSSRSRLRKSLFRSFGLPVGLVPVASSP